MGPACSDKPSAVTGDSTCATKDPGYTQRSQLPKACPWGERGAIFQAKLTAPMLRLLATCLWAVPRGLRSVGSRQDQVLLSPWPACSQQQGDLRKGGAPTPAWDPSCHPSGCFRASGSHGTCQGGIYTVHKRAEPGESASHWAQDPTEEPHSRLPPRPSPSVLPLGSSTKGSQELCSLSPQGPVSSPDSQHTCLLGSSYPASPLANSSPDPSSAAPGSGHRLLSHPCAPLPGPQRQHQEPGVTVLQVSRLLLDCPLPHHCHPCPSALPALA